jgi:hypothetical protein
MTPLRLIIAAVDRTAWLANGYSIDIEKVLSSETFHFAILDLDSTAGAYRPSVGDDIQLTRTDEGGDDIELLFGGEIATVVDEPIVDDSGTVTRIRCRDRMILADQVFLPPRTYASATVLEVFNAIVVEYLGPKGVVNISAVTGGPVLPELRIDDFVTSVRQVLDRISLQSGWPWRINGARWAGLDQPGDLPGPATLSDDGQSVLTDPPLRWEQEGLTHATRVWVQTAVPEAGPGPFVHTEVTFPPSGTSVVPVHVLPTEIRGGTTADAASGATSLSLDGLPHDASIRIGARFQIETHTTVYVLTGSTTTDADGAATVSLSAGLEKDVPSGTSVTFLRGAFVQLELNNVVTPMDGSPYVWEPIENAIVYPAGDLGGVLVRYRTWVLHPTMVREWDPVAQLPIGWFDYATVIDQLITEEEGHTDLETARTFAQAELAKRLTPPKRVTCTTRIPGHYPMLLVPMDFPDRLVVGDYLVAETRIRHSTIDENSDEQPLLYELVLWEGDSLGESWIQYFRGRNPSQGIRWGAVPPEMGMQWTTNVEYTAPAGAAAVSVTPSGTAWAYSAWVDVIASTAAASVLTAVHVVVAGVAVECEFQVGVGAAAAEVAIASVRSVYNSTVSSTGEHRFPIPIDAIPAAARVAIRMRKAGTNVTPWTFAIGYMEKPITGDLQVSVKPTVIAGAGAAATVVAWSTTAWVFGAWTQLIASASGDLVVVALALSGSNLELELEIGIGAAAAEVTLTTVRVFVSAANDGPGYLALPNPLTGIPSGARVAARMRKAGTSASGCSVALIYMVAPL